MLVDARTQLDRIAAALGSPGLVVVAGLPGSGKTALAREAIAAAGATAHAGGGLATLRDRAGSTLSVALRAPVPTNDLSLTVEAVRARVGHGVLLLDDLQWADRFTSGLLPRLAAYVRVVAVLRMPAPLLDDEPARLRTAATVWVEPPELGPESLAAVARSIRPNLDDAAAAILAERCGGNVGVLVALATHTAAGALPGIDGIATMVSELPRAERTALAALGLLGRPAGADVLGPAGGALVERGLATPAGDRVRPSERVVAEVAAGILPAHERAALHRRLAELVATDGEAARHLAAAGDRDAAASRARAAAAATTSIDTRAAYLALACQQRPDDSTGRAAAAASHAAGRGAEAIAALESIAEPDAADRVTLATWMALSALAAGDPGAATMTLAAVAAEVARVPDDVRAAHRAASLRAAAAVDPAPAKRLAESGPPLTGPLELAAYAGVLRAAGDEHWDRPLREVLATAGESATAWPLAADLIAGLRARLRSDLAAEAADAWARRAADAAAYGWEMVFRTEALWAHLHTDGTTERTAAIGTALARHDLPETARPLLASARALAVADRGDLARARALAGADSATCLGRWLGAELALLDGDETSAQALAGGLLVDLADDDPALPLTVLTAAWAGTPTTDRAHLPSPLQLTLLALETGAWAAAAGAWNGALRRERVRALLAEAGGDTGGTAPTGAAVGILQDAERIATEGGLAVLAGRARRELRRRGALVDQPERPAPGADEHGLSGREREVIDLVAQGQSSRRIAERLGLTSHTVESYVKSAMQKLGARTRTEATVLARRTR